MPNHSSHRHVCLKEFFKWRRREKSNPLWWFWRPLVYLKHCDKNGGDKRNRTDDILLAKQTLYQLSYIPEMVPSVGIEPTTFRLSSECSNQLSYEGVKWWARSDLNRDSTNYEFAAFTN